MIQPRLYIVAAGLALAGSAACARGLPPEPPGERAHIRPYAANPWYWQYDGRPVLLVGGTDDDNLFQWEEDRLREHLDLLVSVGGNYVRNTMSSRDVGSARPFARVEEGRYDLTRWDDEYWRRFDRFLRLASERDIVVQIELWDPWDYYLSRDRPGAEQGGWAQQPFNPRNNVNYDAAESRLLTEVDFPPSKEPTDHSFFHTVPALEDNEVVLRYQRAFIDRILSSTLKFPNVLYTINNESGEPVEWSAYWAEHIRGRAAEAGVPVQVSDMRRTNDINAPEHRVVQDRAELFSFADISQNNGRKDASFWERPEPTHWDPIIALRERLRGSPRPLNNVKIYGGSGGWGGAEQGVQKFWRNVFAGSASSRFHRPPAGIGLDQRARAHLRSIRLLEEEFDFFTAEPDGAHRLLTDRAENEAYLSYTAGEQYAIYFPDAGSIELDLRGAPAALTLRWLDIGASRWGEAKRVAGRDLLRLTTPGPASWVALVRKESS